jgi:hypothetical protein
VVTKARAAEGVATAFARSYGRGTEEPHASILVQSVRATLRRVVTKELQEKVWRLVLRYYDRSTERTEVGQSLHHTASDAW